MFDNLKNILIGVFAAITVVVAGASAYTALAASAGNGNNTPAVAANYGQNNGTGTSVLDIPASDLSADEAASLLFMREEEKLARDV